MIFLIGTLGLGCGTQPTAKSPQATPDLPETLPQEDTDDVLDTALPATDTAVVEVDTATDSGLDTGIEPEPCEPPLYDPNPFITSVVSYDPGAGAGFGQDQFPDIVFGPPQGAGQNAGSLDVLSLGQNGTIVVSFDYPIVDGIDADLIVFENGFTGWSEPAIVSASQDGATWIEWPCELVDESRLYEGCAGITPVLSHPNNCIDARNADQAGGDAFDLQDIGLTEAQFIRIQDAGVSGPGGFDLDAAVRVH